ncbi:hypothetical protein LR48_Vigan11g065800 [Vigna angularis]|uniref:Uncharacterized protein n=1 Tax=Phaseolus angularis TaxID=3914 RepID=A0A0L9VRD1_PHAAN|nr:hypothetical protein LR48_Vigan11g065800 [Vigna angularis]
MKKWPSQKLDVDGSASVPNRTSYWNDLEEELKYQGVGTQKGQKKHQKRRLQNVTRRLVALFSGPGHRVHIFGRLKRTTTLFDPLEEDLDAGAVLFIF